MQNTVSSWTRCDNFTVVLGVNYGGILLPHTCKINYVNMQHNYINKSHVDIIMLHVDINKSYVDLIMLHVDINESHVYIIMLHVDITYLV